MKRLLLLSPPVLHGDGWWSNRDAGKPHLESLAAHVRDLVKVDLLELDRGDVADPLAALDDAMVADVDLVGVSCWTSLHYLGAVEIIEHLRRAHPGVAVVVGGHHVTGMPSDFDGLADWVVTGDGEAALRRICEADERPSATTHVTGRPHALTDDDALVRTLAADFDLALFHAGDVDASLGHALVEHRLHLLDLEIGLRM